MCVKMRECLSQMYFTLFITLTIDVPCSIDRCLIVFPFWSVRLFGEGACALLKQYTDSDD